jgi:hypothetical protein
MEVGVAIVPAIVATLTMTACPAASMVGGTNGSANARPAPVRTAKAGSSPLAIVSAAGRKSILGSWPGHVDQYCVARGSGYLIEQCMHLAFEAETATLLGSISDRRSRQR